MFDMTMAREGTADRPAWQPKAALWAAIHAGWVLNAPVFWRQATGGGALADEGVMLAAQAVLVLALCWLLFSAAAAGGRWTWRLGVGLVLPVSALCAYFMARFNVVIGYGVLQAVFTTDHDMSGELVDMWLLLWMVVAALLPAIVLWRQPLAPSMWASWRNAQDWRRRLLTAGVVLALAAAALWALVATRARLERPDQPDLPPLGAMAYAYVPSNWMAGLGMTLTRVVQEWRAERQLMQPAQRFHYVPTADLRGMTVVLVIGETARHDRFGLLGHARETTPRLASDPGVVALRGLSCDTATKLSLACMFVRPEGLRTPDDLGPDQVLEDNVFSVLRHLGFRSELYAMQGEAGFYNRAHVDFYKLREVIVASPANAGKPAHDALLLPELDAVLARQQRAGEQAPPQLVILHTKGSHHLYSKRYPREFARWLPDCSSGQTHCGRDELLNAFDNSILYTDHFLGEVLARLRTRKAMLVYSSDHGESISETTHFHATPRRIAPPEQRAVPLVFWASTGFLADPVLAQGWQRLREKRERPDGAQPVGHRNLYASLLGCLGVRSPDGGLTAADNLCD